MTAEPQTFGLTDLVTAPHASIDVGSSKLMWAPTGNPAVLDMAAVAILDAFTDGLSPEELAHDLESAVGLDSEVARQAAFNTAYALRMSGLVFGGRQEPTPSWHFHYPPPGST